MASPATGTKKKNKGKNQSDARKWKRTKAEEIEVPSGNIALIKRPGMEVFLFEGLLPDALQPMVQEAIQTGKGLPQNKVKDLSKDENAIQDMMDTMDRVTARVVVAPKVLWHKRPVLDGEGNPRTEKVGEGKESFEKQVLETIPEDERVDADGVLYTDDIDFEDKSFIFQYAVGGTRDLERFRRESDEGLESVRDGDDVPVPTKRASRARSTSS